MNEVIHTWGLTKVEIDHSRKKIIISAHDYENSVFGEYYPEKLATFSPSVTIENYDQLFIGEYVDILDRGENPKTNVFYGNRVLVGIGYNKYLLIGEDIHYFQFPERIEKFYATVGNSAVLYTSAQSKNFSIYFGECIYFSNEYLNDDEMYDSWNIPRGELENFPYIKGDYIIDKYFDNITDNFDLGCDFYPILAEIDMDQSHIDIRNEFIKFINKKLYLV